MLTRESNRNTPHIPLSLSWKKRFLVLSFLVLSALLIIIATLPEDNQGTPSQNPEGDEFKANCGINDEGCHADHKDPNLDVYTTPDTEDARRFAAPIEKDGEKLGPDDYDVQAKAVATDGKSSYIHSLDDTDNDGQLDLTSYDPEEEEEFWVGFGYKKDGSIFVYARDEAYTFPGQCHEPVPVAKISLEPDFPNEPEKTIEVTEEDNGKTLTGTLSKNGTLTVYFTGEDSYDEDGDELSYYWDIDGDGKFETGEQSGDNLNETGMTYQYDYTERRTYHLKFRVADGRHESNSIFFDIEVEETEKKPELFVDDVTVETEDEENAVDADIYTGDELEITAFIRNHDESGYGAPTTEDVMVNVYYAMRSEGYQTWYLFDDMPIDLGRINIEGQKKAGFTWDTTDFQPDEYRIRVVVDEAGDVDEWDEENNQGAYDGIVKIKSLPPPTYPEISLKDIELSSTKIMVNEEVEVDVTVLNTGDGDGEYLVVLFYVDGKYKQTSSYFSVPASGSKKLSDTDNGVFTWSPSEVGNYSLRLKLSYFDETGEQTVELEENVKIPPPIIKPPPPKNATTSESTPWYQTTSFYGVVVIACVGAISGIVFVVKRQ